MTQFGGILDVFEDFSILAEKQRLKPRKLNSLMNFASLDAQLDPQVARLVKGNKSWVKNPVWSAVAFDNHIQAIVANIIQPMAVNWL